MSIMVEYDLPKWCEGCIRLDTVETRRSDNGAVILRMCSHLEACKVMREQWKLDDKQTDKINGNTSDGYHTFNELYHHRAILFAVICNANKDKAWKSKKHSDGTMYDGMFIVGINTPHGDYTYHYNIKPYWNLFDVKTLAFAPEWDGHKPEDIDRLLSVPVFGQWNKLTFRELTEEEEEDYPEQTYIIEGLPPYYEIVLITDGEYVWEDCFRVDDAVYLDPGDVIAWMPLPEPPKKGEEDD